MDANAAALIAQAGQFDAGDRAEAACGLATAVTGREDDPAVGALIRLTQDAAPDVRDQATFAPGTPAPTDGPAVRAAPRARLDDSDPDTREEAVRGLALRRDPRAVPLLTELLAADSAHLHTFRAAAVLADPALLPALERYEPADPGVAEALEACAPGRRERRDRAAATLLEEVYRLLPDTDAAVSAHRMEATPVLTLTAGDTPLTWNVDRLLVRADGDAPAAAALVAQDVAEVAPARV
ncbi:MULTISPECIES: HEAT repeat domain-containing protein [Streptomyces]|uniref:HEAT repeat domain-containing protein n=2 Tax=Streptomyces TaxID=1883 RepID=A0ABV9J8X0_9ACTN